MLLNVDDYRGAARRRLPRGLFDFLDRGSEDDRALLGNRTALAELNLRPRILAGVADRTLSVTVLARRYALPIGLAPVGIAGYLWHRGEAALAHAAAASDIPLVLSGATSLSLDEVAATGSADKWFQLYVSGDRARTLGLVRRAHALGFRVLVLTADSLVQYKREFATRSGFDIPFRPKLSALVDMLCHPRWLVGTIGRYAAERRFPAPAEYPLPPPGDPERGRYALKDDSLDWKFLAELRALWPGKLVVKGVLAPEDARACVEHGVDGVIVSNHGGIALDASVAPAMVLRQIADVVDGRAAVILDGGIRRGSDVVKARALGADMVLIGRAAMYGLAARGKEGVVDVLQILGSEVDRVLAQIGCRSMEEVRPDHLTPPAAQRGEWARSPGA